MCVRIYILHHVCLLVLQDVVGEDPGQGHLNGELDTLTHRQLQEELPEPQLGEVTALPKGAWGGGGGGGRDWMDRVRRRRDEENR